MKREDDKLRFDELIKNADSYYEEKNGIKYLCDKEDFHSNLKGIANNFALEDENLKNGCFRNKVEI